MFVLPVSPSPKFQFVFCFMAKDFRVTILETSATNGIKALNVKYTPNTLYTYPWCPKRHSILFYNQPFSSYMPLWECTECPPNDLKHYSCTESQECHINVALLFPPDPRLQYVSIYDQGFSSLRNFDFRVTWDFETSVLNDILLLAVKQTLC